jgi:hypothetical protein
MRLLLWKSAATEVNLQRGAVLVNKSAIIKSDIYQGITTLTLGNSVACILAVASFF